MRIFKIITPLGEDSEHLAVPCRMKWDFAEQDYRFVEDGDPINAVNLERKPASAGRFVEAWKGHTGEWVFAWDCLAEREAD